MELFEELGNALRPDKDLLNMTPVILTQYEYAKKLMEGATLRFDKEEGEAFINWFSENYPHISINFESRENKIVIIKN